MGKPKAKNLNEFPLHLQLPKGVDTHGCVACEQVRAYNLDARSAASGRSSNTGQFEEFRGKPSKWAAFSLKGVRSMRHYYAEYEKRGELWGVIHHTPIPSHAGMRLSALLAPDNY